MSCFVFKLKTAKQELWCVSCCQKLGSLEAAGLFGADVTYWDLGRWKFVLIQMCFSKEWFWFLLTISCLFLGCNYKLAIEGYQQKHGYDVLIIGGTGHFKNYGRWVTVSQLVCDSVGHGWPFWPDCLYPPDLTHCLVCVYYSGCLHLYVLWYVVLFKTVLVFRIRLSTWITGVFLCFNRHNFHWLVLLLFRK